MFTQNGPLTYGLSNFRIPTASFYHDLWQTEDYIIFVDTSLRKDHARIRKVYKKPEHLPSSENGPVTF